MESAAKSARFNCGECGKNFIYRKSLNEHLLKLHPDSYFAKELEQNNFESVVKNIRFRCAVCYKGYIYRRALSEHIRLKHSVSTSIYHEEENILEMNVEEIRFRCARCSKNFISQKALSEHIRRAHPDMYMKTENKENMMKSITEEIIYNCDECSQSFMYYENLFEHLQKFHPVSFIPPINPTSTMKDENNASKRCPAGYQSYNFRNYPKRFKRTSSRIKYQKVLHSTKRINVKKREKYICGTCLTYFNHRKSLIRHIQDKHPEELCQENSIQIFECPICYETFQYRFNLNQHFKREHPDKQIIKEKRNFKDFKCTICDDSFRYRFNLTRHILKKHSFDNCEDREYSNCKFCDKRFLYRFNLNSHIRKKHPDMWVSPKSRKEINYICAHCDRRYSRRISLIQHIRLKHPASITPPDKFVKRPLPPESTNKRIPASRLCPLCPAAFVRKSEMLNHFRDDHDRLIKTKIIELSDEDAFNDWKYQIEDETKSKYVKYNFYKTQKEAVRVFICHRSGCFQSRSKGLRHLRLAGSEKINGYCPAEIKVIIPNNKQRCFVHFTDVHVGHGQELQFLKLQEPREVTKCPVDEILDEQSSYRVPTKCVDLSPEDKQLTDAIILTTWLNDNYRSVLYFKGQEETDDNFPLLNSGEDGDFLLIVMNGFQVDMLKQYGSDIVTINRMDGPDGYGLELSIIMVLDNFRQGIPCCFMLSNRNDQYVYEIMFAKVAEHTGQIRPKVFMSLVTDTYAKAWNSVMLAPERQLYCSWHVLRLWEQKLTSVKNVDVRKSLRQFLYELRMELSPMRFHELLHQFLKEPHDDLTEFQEYFKQNFFENVPLWAYCYRKYAGINTNFVTERFFRMFRQTYLENKSTYTFEEGLDALSLLMQNLPVEKIIREVKGKLVSKLRHLRERHKECSVITTEQLDSIQWVSQEKWKVPSFGVEADEVYFVEQILPSCDCKLRCNPCKSCLHEYRCSCLDNCIQYNMCTHIHLVCIWKNKLRKNNLIQEVVVNEIDSMVEVLSDLSVDDEECEVNNVSP